LVYLNSFQGSWQFDDEPAIIENYRIRSLSNIPQIFRDPFSRPVLQTTFALNYHFGRLDPWGYHLVNLLLHISVSILIYFIIGDLISAGPQSSPGVPGTLPFLAALLFAVHPINTESVTYIVSRSAVLATFFYLVAFLAFIRGMRRWRSGGKISGIFCFKVTALAFILGLGTKEIVLSLPIMLLVYLYYFHFLPEEGGGPLSFVKRYKWLLLGLIAPFVGYLIYRHLHGGLMFTLAARRGVRSPYVNLLTEVNVIVRYYLRRLLIPVGLNVDPQFPEFRSPFNLSTALSIAVIAGLLYLARRVSRKVPLMAFAILWFFVTLAPESSVIPLLDVAAEHRLYLPEMGFAIAFVYLIFSIGRWLLVGQGERAGVVVVCVVASVFSFGTVRRNSVYRSSLELWSDAVKKSPHKWRSHSNLADAYTKLGRLDEAIREYRWVLDNYREGKTARVRAHHGLGNIYQEQGRFEEAVEEYRKALSLDSTFVLARNNLGSAYYRLGRYDDAIREYKKVLKVKRNYVKTYNNLAIAYAGKGEVDSALSAVKRALSIDPDYAIGYNTLANIYYSKKAYREALLALKRAIEIKPNFAEAYLTVGNVCVAIGDAENAMKAYSEALRIKPDLVGAHRALGLLCARVGKKEKAIYHLKEVLRLAPDAPGRDAIEKAIKKLTEGG